MENESVPLQQHPLQCSDLALHPFQAFRAQLPGAPKGQSQESKSILQLRSSFYERTGETGYRAYEYRAKLQKLERLHLVDRHVIPATNEQVRHPTLQIDMVVSE